jgi:glycosyltransferase involved in cell wall biosynthesis
MPPLVSFIIPAYKCASFLPQAIDSALAQTHAHVEIIVVNDGSPDDTDDVVKPYLDRITYLKQENRGLSAARNVGFRASHGDFICFLDADDAVLPGKIERQLDVFRREPDLGIVISGYVDVEEDGRTEILSVRKLWNRDGLERLLRHEVFPPHAALIRRSALEASSLFPEDIDTWESQEDWQLWLEMALAGVQFGSYPEPTCLYRQRAGSIRRNALRHSDGARRVVRWILTNYSAAIDEAVVGRLVAIVELERTAIAWTLGLEQETLEALGISMRADPLWWQDPATLRLLHLRTMTLSDTVRWRNRPDPEAMRLCLMTGLLPVLRGRFSRAECRRLDALAFLACADESYSRRQWAASCRYAVQALENSFTACMRPKSLRSLLRSFAGPHVGELIGRAERRVREH